MRSGQQNKRGRGRNNNTGRKNGNPLSRSYDSSGPDVKIRGTAQHIAEKYATMARDAHGSGDTVMAENYFQHAEHYNRIILAAQAQLQERYQRDDREAAERDQSSTEMDDVSDDTEIHNGTAAPVMGSGPQPVIDGTPLEVTIDEENSRQSQRRSPLRRRGPGRPKRVSNGNGSAEASSPEQPDAGSGAGKGESAHVPTESKDHAPKAEAASEA
jgi:hypothetical protein